MNLLANRNKKDAIDYLNIDGIKTYNKSDVANSFGKFFSNVGENIVDNFGVTTHDFTEYITTYANTSLFLYPTDRYEIGKIIMSLNNTSLYGYNGTSNRLLKQEICFPLEITFNKSLRR